jgi:molybdopterin converting factor small subunit
MQIDLQLFATLKDHAGTDRIRVEVPDEAITISGLPSWLTEAAPALAPFLPTALRRSIVSFSLPSGFESR